MAGTRAVSAFGVDHIIPIKHRGSDALSNLALACVSCNLHRSCNLTGIDPNTRKVTRLLHPRRHRWDRHFRWDGTTLVGKTAIGRTSIVFLEINLPDRQRLRDTLVELGFWPY